MATTKTRTKTASEPAVTAPKTRKKLTLDSSVRLSVRSNQYCILGFTNRRTGTAVTWRSFNEEQVLKVEDIEFMRSNAPRFFRDTWIVIDRVLDEEYADLSQEEIYTALGIEHFFNTGVPMNLADALKWDVKTISERTSAMSQDAKDNLATALNVEVANGNLVDIRVIRAWEQALGTKLEIDEEE